MTYHSDGTIYIDTLYSRLLGKPPIMVAGMHWSPRRRHPCPASRDMGSTIFSRRAREGSDIG
jgi:enoyl reductase-like protein